MRYLDLIAAQPLTWGLFILYMVGTSWLAWLGFKKTTDISSYSIGSGDMSPWVVGITLAASIASTATFVINPGFVYVHGVSALMHFGGAAGLGLILGLVTMSTGFRKIGAKTKALTLPQWVGERYGSRAMTFFFACLNLLSISFIVLIVGSVSIVMQKTMGLTNMEALVLTITFVFGYIFIGGTWAHAYTNTLQGAIMALVAVVIVGSGLHLFGDGLGAFMAKVEAHGPHLVTLTNPKSPLFGSTFSVFVSGFIIGFALVCQPHILTKALYVKDDRAVAKYLAITIAVSLTFSALLLVGLYAHVLGIAPEKFVDPTTGVFRQDLVMMVYLGESFPPSILAFITVALLAAGMSTLDGILVALSSIASNDIFLNLTRDNLLKDKDDKARGRIAYWVSQGILVALGVASFFIALDPPKLLGIFGQVGVYGIVAASAAPILFGILVPEGYRKLAFSAALVGPVVHFALYAWGDWAIKHKVNLVEQAQNNALMGLIFDTSAPQLGLANPGVTATYGLIASGLIVLPALVMHYARPLSSSPPPAANAATPSPSPSQEKG